jgi:hypothetical protein
MPGFSASYKYNLPKLQQMLEIISILMHAFLVPPLEVYFRKSKLETVVSVQGIRGIFQNFHSLSANFIQFLP